MPNTPYVVLSAATSIDGYIDDATGQHLLLSNDEDFDRVHDVRAGVDAILVGANTVRQDNPRLLVRSHDRRDRRLAAGLPFSPIKVTLTSTSNLSSTANFFTEGAVDKLVYAPAPEKASASLSEAATIVEATDLQSVLRDLGARGIQRLMVEGGTTMHTPHRRPGRRTTPSHRPVLRRRPRRGPLRSPRPLPSELNPPDEPHRDPPNR
ncbi:hypothetical protein GCM10022235_77600 [Kribbella ginsengisoli]|uniref:Bacterial bifunctional deaminase-reductase C-terminal domain-containing protein n=1 Tax=Kribbella ginsengisoli TaxID=363865 RepID=A0ABP6Z2B8_9ACTN